MGDSKIEPRSKGEWLARKHTDCTCGRVVCCTAVANQALEWAAQQCEQTGKRFRRGIAQEVARNAAAAIRAGKS